jgi:hypothetical protein
MEYLFPLLKTKKRFSLKLNCNPIVRHPLTIGGAVFSWLLQNPFLWIGMVFLYPIFIYSTLNGALEKDPFFVIEQ